MEFKLIHSMQEFKQFKQNNPTRMFEYSKPACLPCYIYVGYEDSLPMYRYLYKHNIQEMLDNLELKR